MKKVLIIIFILLLSCSTVSVFAANEISLEFLREEWSEENQYPEWYGGRYIDENSNMTYVIVEKYKDMLPTDFLKFNNYVLKKYSYNELKLTLNEITDNWMGTTKLDEVVCLQSAGLDEKNNYISIDLYTGSDKVESMRDQLYIYFGDLISVSTTNGLIVTTPGVIPEKQLYNYKLLTSFALLIMISLGLILAWRKRIARRYAIQTADGDVVDKSPPGNIIETISLIKTMTITPDDSVFEKIMRDIS